MSDLKYLEIQRLIRELQFLESDYKYQSEIIKMHEGIFMQSIDNIIEKFPDIKKYMKSEKNNIDISHDLRIDSKPTYVDPDQKIKNVYRSIVKITHPDKVNNKKLNDLYLEATNSYESGDFLSLYKVSIDLKIDFDWGDEEISEIRRGIEEYKSQILLLKSTFTYKWILSENKNNIIIEYLKSNLDHANIDFSTI